MVIRTVIALAAVAISLAFRPIEEDPAYKAKLEEWHQKRIASLKREDGWLNLAGLFWLEEGKNSTGSSPDNKIVFPKGSANIGSFELSQGKVTFIPSKDAVVTSNGEKITTPTVVFDPSAKPVTLQHNALKWVIIKRGDQYGIRLRDLESDQLKHFPGIERYPVNEAYRVKARLEKPTEPKTIAITNILGQTSNQPLAGTLVFDLSGKTYRLDATGEDKLFIVFGDATNGKETYGGGRFLYVDYPAADGTATVDFNQAVNPPCAFTPFATCPLPTKQNKLAVRIPAGEKKFGDH
ncbi:MAG: DUF1684 domain-containing protein [Siphonobacter sp.]